ncbi:hypothetical protein OAF61_03945 [Pseudomonadales bacterium]|nr:hypothetical protein [Pseudomonadales bacterium]
MNVEKKFKKASDFDKRVVYFKKRKIPLILTLSTLLIFLFPPTYFVSCLKNVCRNTGFEFINIFEVSSRVIIATPILALELFSLFFLVAFWYLFEERNSRLNQILINHYSENIRLKKELNALKEKSVNQ